MKKLDNCSRFKWISNSFAIH